MARDEKNPYIDLTRKELDVPDVDEVDAGKVGTITKDDAILRELQTMNQRLDALLELLAERLR